MESSVAGGGVPEREAEQRPTSPTSLHYQPVGVNMEKFDGFTHTANHA